MKLLNKKNILVGLLVLMVSFGFIGCSSEDSNGGEAPNNTENGLEGTISVVGSTSVTPTAEAIGNAFMEEHPNVSVEIQGVGSSAGVKAANEGTADIGMASREIKEEELEFGLDEHIIAYDGIAVVVHPNNEVEDLSSEQIGQIYKGEITNWSDVGGADIDIEVISREEGSGTRSAFEELMNLLDDNGASLVKQDATFANGNGAIISNASQKEGAIGYVSLSYLNDSIKTINVDGVVPTVENIQAGEYSVSRPFLMLTKGEVSELTQAYLDFIFSDQGQAIAEEQGGISVN